MSTNAIWMRLASPLTARSIQRNAVGGMISRQGSTILQRTRSLPHKEMLNSTSVVEGTKELKQRRRTRSKKREPCNAQR